MRRGGAGKRRDATEKPIAEALRGLGCVVVYISGAGCPDLLVRAPGPSRRWQPLEVKSAGGRLTKRQQDLPWPVVRTPQDAITAVFD